MTKTLKEDKQIISDRIFQLKQLNKRIHEGAHKWEDICLETQLTNKEVGRRKQTVTSI
jgi:hypothetical protein